MGDLVASPFGSVGSSGKSFKQIPQDTIVHCIVESAFFKESTKNAKSQFPGKKYQIWNLTLRALNPEYAGQIINDALFLDIEWKENLGDWVPHDYNDNYTPALMFLRAVGLPVEDDSGVLKSGWLPPNQTFFEQMLEGTGTYEGKPPVVGSFVTVKTRIRFRPKKYKDSQTGRWEQLLDTDGNPVKAPYVGVADWLETPKDVRKSLAVTAAKYSGQPPF